MKMTFLEKISREDQPTRTLLALLALLYSGYFDLHPEDIFPMNINYLSHKSVWLRSAGKVP